MLKCKFRVSQIIREREGRTLVLQASDEKTGDNKDWSKWTPSGEMNFHVTNQDAFPQIDALNPGDHFWIDLNKVEAAKETA